jgi:ABC-type multidrug transport system fused ATPase/permease subunit
LFSRLLRLPLDYFERHPAGETMYRVAQVSRVREFLTGQLLATFLDLLTLAVLLPFLFWLNARLAWIVLLCANERGRPQRPAASAYSNSASYSMRPTAHSGRPG